MFLGGLQFLHSFDHRQNQPEDEATGEGGEAHRGQGRNGTNQKAIFTAKANPLNLVPETLQWFPISARTRSRLLSLHGDPLLSHLSSRHPPSRLLPALRTQESPSRQRGRDPTASPSSSQAAPISICASIQTSAFPRGLLELHVNCFISLPNQSGSNIRFNFHMFKYVPLQEEST